MSQLSNDDLTGLIQLATNGDSHAESLLCEAVYDELHSAAARLLRDSDASLQPTMLVHDVFMGIFRKRGIDQIVNRKYFFSVAIDHMRKLLVDHYRRRSSQKAGGNWQRSPLDGLLDGLLHDVRAQNACDIVELNDALDWLRNSSERQYQIVTQRYFAGLTVPETARLLAVSVSNVEREWRVARAKLYRYLQIDD